jgi:type IV pilus assembly protein PilW
MSRETRKHRHYGMSLIEVMVALGIGTFLIVGAFTVYLQSRSTYEVNASIARLQENGRYFFDVVEPDIRMASHFGLTTRGAAVAGQATPTQPASPLAPARDCGNNWTVDLASAVEGSNNGYRFACPAVGTAASTADTLVIRRASVRPVDRLDENTLYVRSARNGTAALFRGTTVPAGFATRGSATHELVVNGYYVSRNSSLDTPGNPVPALRRKFLRNGASGGPVVADQEVLPGVEDMQVEFGVDTDPPGASDHGVVNRYVAPDDAILDETHAAFLPHARILSIRIWLRIRSEQREAGLAPGAGFAYADQSGGPIDDGFRRIVVSKTIVLRNMREAT